MNARERLKQQYGERSGQPASPPASQPAPPVSRPPAPEQPPARLVNGLLPYVAYKADRNQDRLDIRRVLGDSAMPKYNFLVDVRYNAGFEDQLTLIYTVYTVKIQGKNLRSVRVAIAESRCDFIQAFHPNEHAAPDDPDAAVITSILFTIDEEQKAEEEK